MVKNKRAVSRRRYHSVPRDALRGYFPRLCTVTLCDMRVLKYERAAFLTIAGTTEYSEDKKMFDGYTMDVLEQRIGYCFHNKALLKQALTHSSYTNEQKINKTENYERIEFWEMPYWSWYPATSCFGNTRMFRRAS